MFDSQAHQIRPLLGVPGAALLGAAVEAGGGIAGAVLSPRQDYALILSGDNREVRLLQLRPEGAVTGVIEGAAMAPDRMFLSPAGSAAALYRKATGTAQILTGLPDSPVLAREVAVAGAGQDATTLAISDDGRILLSADDNQAVLVTSADGATVSIPLGERVQALAFRPGSQDAAAATGSRIFLLPDVAHGAQPVRVAGAEEGIAGPTAIDFSSDGQQLFAVNSPGMVTVSDLAAGSTAGLDCGCTPAGLYRLRGTAVFRLTDALNQLRLVDGTTNPSRILFIPPDPAGAIPDAGGSQGNQQ